MTQNIKNYSQKIVECVKNLCFGIFLWNENNCIYVIIFKSVTTNPVRKIKKDRIKCSFEKIAYNRYNQ